jgi:hypothetical protein
LKKLLPVNNSIIPEMRVIFIDTCFIPESCSHFSKFGVMLFFAFALAPLAAPSLKAH